MTTNNSFYFFFLLFRFCTKWANIHFAAWRTKEKGGVGGVVSWSSKQKCRARVSVSPTIGHERGIPLSAQVLRVGCVSGNSAGARPSCLLYMINGQPCIRQQQQQQLGDFGLIKSTGQDDGTATTTKSHHLYAIESGTNLRGVLGSGVRTGQAGAIPRVFLLSRDSITSKK
jgi:hypothetical protein